MGTTAYIHTRTLLSAKRIYALHYSSMCMYLILRAICCSEIRERDIHMLFRILYTIGSRGHARETVTRRLALRARGGRPPFTVHTVHKVRKSGRAETRGYLGPTFTSCPFLGVAGFAQVQCRSGGSQRKHVIVPRFTTQPGAVTPARQLTPARPLVCPHEQRVGTAATNRSESNCQHSPVSHRQIDL